MPHNIVSSIPLTDATNPNKFPEYEYHEYPKQMTKKCTKEDVEAWEQANKRVDEVTGRASYGMGRPRVGSPIPFYGEDGMPVVVHDAEEEEEFRLQHPDALVITTIDPAGMMDELERLRAENARLIAEKQGDNNAKHAAVLQRTKPVMDEDDKSEGDPDDSPVARHVGPESNRLGGLAKPSAVKGKSALPPALKKGK